MAETRKERRKRLRAEEAATTRAYWEEWTALLRERCIAHGHLWEEMPWNAKEPAVILLKCTHCGDETYKNPTYPCGPQ